jgi:hypothetical protein
MYQGLQNQLCLTATPCSLHHLYLLLLHQPFSQLVPRTTTTPHLSHDTYPSTSRRAKQEVIEEPIPTTATVQPITMDSTCYAAMHNNSRSISPINPDPHHFQSYSPPRICQEEGEIGEITDTPSSLTSSLPMAALAMNRSASMGTTVPSSGSNASLPRGPSAKRTDFGISRSVSSSSQVRHSPPRSFNTSLPFPTANHHLQLPLFPPLLVVLVFHLPQLHER